MKDALSKGGVKRQGLLLPEIVEMDPSDCQRLVDQQERLAKVGLVMSLLVRVQLWLERCQLCWDRQT